MSDLSLLKAPHPGVLHGEDKLPEHFALKVSRAYFREIGVLWKMKTPLLKGTENISQALGPRAEATI